MKTISLLFCLMWLLPCSARADEKVDLAKEIMELTHVNKMMDQVKAQVLQLQSQILAQLDIPENKREEAERFQKKVHDKIFEVMSFEQMQKEYVELYSSVYTLEEMKGMIQFYKSPVGKSMIEKQPTIVKKSIDISQSKVRILIPELQKITEEFEHALKN
jgi:uncharacterized protein